MFRFLLVILLLPLSISSCTSGGQTLCGMIEGYPAKYWKIGKHTEMTLINDNPSEIKDDGYVAVAALDTSDTPYMLFTPIIKDDGCSESENLKDIRYDVRESTSFIIEDTEALFDTLNGIVKHLQSDKPLSISDTAEVGAIDLRHRPQRTSFVKEDRGSNEMISPKKILFQNPVQIFISYDKNGMKRGTMNLENRHGSIVVYLDDLRALKRFNDILVKGIKKMEVMTEG